MIYYYSYKTILKHKIFIKSRALEPSSFSQKLEIYANRLSPKPSTSTLNSTLLADTPLHILLVFFF